MTDLSNWGESDFLLVKDVQDNDIVNVDDVIGLVESFGKQKCQVMVSHNGKKKIVNLNKFQFRQMQPLTRGRAYTVSKEMVNGGLSLHFKALA